MPAELTLRVVRCRLEWRGFRTHQVLLVTSLLDRTQYPAQALSQLYYRRWAMELTLRNIKTTLQMDRLSCKTPQNLEREIRMHFLVHNLVRCLMLQGLRERRSGSPEGANPLARALAGVRPSRRGPGSAAGAD